MFVFYNRIPLQICNQNDSILSFATRGIVHREFNSVEEAATVWIQGIWRSLQLLLQFVLLISCIYTVATGFCSIQSRSYMHIDI